MNATSVNQSIPSRSLESWLKDERMTRYSTRFEQRDATMHNMRGFACKLLLGLDRLVKYAHDAEDPDKREFYKHIDPMLAQAIKDQAKPVIDSYANLLSTFKKYDAALTQEAMAAYDVQLNRLGYELKALTPYVRRDDFAKTLFGLELASALKLNNGPRRRLLIESMQMTPVRRVPALLAEGEKHLNGIYSRYYSAENRSAA